MAKVSRFDPKSGPTKPKLLDAHQLKQLMRLSPSLEDTAAFFDVSTRLVERFIRKNWDMGFVSFREQNAVHTRLSIVRKIIDKALAGDNAMLIWYSKNKLGWKDRHDIDVNQQSKIQINIDQDDSKL